MHAQPCMAMHQPASATYPHVRRGRDSSQAASTHPAGLGKHTGSGALSRYYCWLSCYRGGSSQPYGGAHATASPCSVRAAAYSYLKLTTRPAQLAEVLREGCAHAHPLHTRRRRAWPPAVVGGSSAGCVSPHNTDKDPLKRNPALTAEEIEARVKACQERRAARAPYHCPACAHHILAAHKLLPHMASCCPDLLVATGSERWVVALGVTPPLVPTPPVPKHQRLSAPPLVTAAVAHQPLPPPPPPPHLLQGAATSPSPAGNAATVAVAAATTVTGAAAASSATSSPHLTPQNPAGTGKPPKSRTMVDDGAVRKLLEEARVKEAELREGVLRLTFRSGDRDPATGELVRHYPEAVAERLGLPVKRVSQLLASALKAVPIPPDTTSPLQVVFEGRGVLAVSKPPGVATTPAHRYKGSSMVNRVMGYLGGACTGGAHVLHRLDQDTSGVLLFATHPTTVHTLHAQFRERTVRKLYLALAVGVPVPLQGGSGGGLVVDAPIGTHPALHVARQAHGGGAKPALTSFAVVAANPRADLGADGAVAGRVFDPTTTPSLRGVSLLACAPHTGRTHQIRVHAALAGHPLLGDDIYGVKGPWIARQALHAVALEVELPDTASLAGAADSERMGGAHAQTQHGKRFAIWAPLPADFRAALKECGIEFEADGDGDVLQSALTGVWRGLSNMAAEQSAGWMDAHKRAVT